MKTKETTRARRYRRALWALGLSVLVIPSCAVVGFYAYMWPGGVHPGYRAVDHDLYLTYRARSAKPVIEAVERNRRENGAYPPSVTDTGEWRYTRTADGYVLDLRLGWDPDLLYLVEGNASRWVFEPGDGTEAKTIVLSP